MNTHNHYSSAQAVNGGMELWEFVQRHRILLTISTIMGAVAGGMYLEMQELVYESTAQVLVINERKSVLPIQGINVTLGYEENLATHSVLIRSPLVVEKAVISHKLNTLESLRNSREPIRLIISGISVSPVDSGGNGSTDILQVSYRGTQAKDCRIILTAVIESYQSFLGESARNISEETVRLISEAKDSLLTQLQRKEESYHRFRQETPLLWDNEKGNNIHHARLNQIEATRLQLLVQYSQTKAQLQALDLAIRRGGKREALRLMINHNNGPQELGSSAQTSQLFSLMLEKQMLLENHGPDHPKVKSVQKRIDITRQLNQGNTFGDGKSVSHSTDFLSVYMDSLREELQASRESLRELNALFEKEREAAKSLSNFEVKDEFYRNDIARTQQLFEGVVKRLEEVGLLGNQGGYKTQVVSTADVGRPVNGRAFQTVVFSCAAGFFLGFLLAYIRELSDKSFRKAEEISGYLGAPLLGDLPDVPFQTLLKGVVNPKIHPVLHAYHQPDSPFAEAVRSIRTALYFSTQDGQKKVIQISSPHYGEGRTSLAANLAVSIANSSKSVLLLDADFRSPAIRALFGIESKVGVSMVIRGDLPATSAIQKTDINNVWVLPSGPIPHNPSELLISSQFQELLSELRERFDFILIDTPPLLEFSDAAAVSARVDGVLLSVRNNTSARFNAVRSAEMLNNLGAQLLGIVLNGIELRRETKGKLAA